MSARLVRFFDGVAVSIVVVCLAALAPLLATPAHACPTVASGLPALSEPAVGRSVVSIDRSAVVLHSADRGAVVVIDRDHACELRIRRFPSQMAALRALRGAV